MATRVPTNVFQYLAGGKISITGAIDMKLANGTSAGGTVGAQNLRALVGANSNAAAYELKVNLEGGKPSVLDSNSAAICRKMLTLATAVNVILLVN